MMADQEKSYMRTTRSISAVEYYNALKKALMPNSNEDKDQK